MAIDVNEEVMVWGGFTPEEFWTGAGVLFGIAVVSVMLSIHVAPMLGGIFFFLFGGGFVGFMVYQRDLPKKYLIRRFQQEGKFLFIKIPGIQGVDVYSAPSSERGQRFKEAMGDENAGR